MKAQEALERYAKMTAPMMGLIDKIKKDPEELKIIQEANGQYNAITFVKMLPFLVKCDEMYEMVGAYFGKTTDEIKGEEFKDFVAQVKELMLDSDVGSFLKPQA
jgi:negative regulator of genetic competence, sporulation and motility